MLGLNIIAAAGLALAAASAAPADPGKDKAEQPKARKVCRTVQMPGRITPERICRKIERQAPEDRNQRSDRAPAEAGGAAR